MKRTFILKYNPNAPSKLIFSLPKIDKSDLKKQLILNYEKEEEDGQENKRKSKIVNIKDKQTDPNIILTFKDKKLRGLKTFEDTNNFVFINAGKYFKVVKASNFYKFNYIFDKENEALEEDNDLIENEEFSIQSETKELNDKTENYSEESNIFLQEEKRKLHSKKKSTNKILNNQVLFNILKESPLTVSEFVNKIRKEYKLNQADKTLIQEFLVKHTTPNEEKKLILKKFD